MPVKLKQRKPQEKTWTDLDIQARYGDELYHRLIAARERWCLDIPSDRDLRELITTYRNIALSAGDGGALGVVLADIERLQESPDHAVLRERFARKAAQARCRSGTASDADRILLAVRKGDTMYGPEECQRCVKHTRNYETYRWTWDAPDPTSQDGEADQYSLSGADCEFVRGCVKCEEEQEEDDAIYGFDPCPT